MDPTLTSLLVRELTILSKSFGQMSRNTWELSRVLLRVLPEYDKTSINKGVSGEEPTVTTLPEGSPSDDPFQADLWRSFD